MSNNEKALDQLDIYNFLSDAERFKLSVRSGFVSDPYVGVYFASDMDDSSDNEYHLVQNHIKEKFKAEVPDRIDGIVDFDGRNAPHKRTRFVENPDYLCLGCSFTEAAGLPNDYSWPSIVRIFTGKTVNNMGLSGVGYKYIFSLALDFINRASKPKTVLALLPDAERFWMPAPFMRVNGAEDISTCTAYFQPPLSTYVLAWMQENVEYEHMRAHYQKVAKYIGVSSSKYGDTFSYPDRNGIHQISPEQVSFSNLSALRMFDRAMTASKIDFRFTSWTGVMSDEHKRTFSSYADGPFAETITNKYDNPKMARWKNFGSLERKNTKICDHRPFTEYQKKFWDIAADNNHPGLHDQIHYAEHLLNQSIPADLLREMP